jgi:Ca2+-binding RTX toxin-like protein
MHVTTGGKVAPGVGGPGVLSSGDVKFASNATYDVDLNGTGAGLHDELNVQGIVQLSFLSTLTATVGFTSIPGDEIVIIRNDEFDPISGVFGGGNVLNFGGVKFTIDYGYDADGNLAFNDVALIRYGAQRALDPCDPTKMALFVSATSGNDLIEVRPVSGNASGEVFINGVSEGVFNWDGHLYVMGQNGDDVINCLMPSREVFLYGNTGNDKLNAGNNLSILIGGFGNDVLTAGSAMDILIGGDGRDNLRGENAADIIITGGSVFDAVTAANRVKLCEIADLWRGGQKTSELTHLLNNTTLISDGDVDTAMGGLGKDYLILGVNDVDDSVKQETIFFV